MPKQTLISDLFVRAALKRTRQESTTVAAEVSPQKGEKRIRAIQVDIRLQQENIQPQIEFGKSEEDLRKERTGEAEKKHQATFSLRALLREENWVRVLSGEFDKAYIKKLEDFLGREYAQGKKIFPPRAEIFSAFDLTPFDSVRAVIIGQDPYHNDGQAHGLSFSVKRGVPPPPSLKNIYKELKEDVEAFVMPDHGCLEGWARQGVLMLNAALTVRGHSANSHSSAGWYSFTDRVISILSSHRQGIVFLLWGGFAHRKEKFIDTKKHAVIKTAHPSPLSARFFLGCRCFSKVNAQLVRFGKEEIDWSKL